MSDIVLTDSEAEIVDRLILWPCRHADDGSWSYQLDEAEWIECTAEESGALDRYVDRLVEVMQAGAA